MNPRWVINGNDPVLRESFVEQSIYRRGDPNHLAMSDLLWEKRELRVELLKLRGIFMKANTGSWRFATSNIMIDEK